MIKKFAIGLVGIVLGLLLGVGHNFLQQPLATGTSFGSGASTGFGNTAGGGSPYGVGTTSPYGILSVEQGTETSSFWVGNNGSSTPSFTINGVNGNGNIGIMNAAPTVPLAFAPAIGNKILLYPTGGLAGYGFGVQPGVLQIYADLSQRVGIGVGQSSVFTETLSVSGTNVGIGTTSPASIFQVSSGASATTTVDFGAQSVTAKTCFNVRNNLGAATSFYFVGTTMVVEAKRCL